MQYLTESQEQIILFNWIRQFPELRDLCFSIPNEGKRSARNGMRLKQMGMLPGVSDIFIAIPSNNYHGLFIELKAKNKNGIYNKPRLSQILFQEKVQSAGYAAAIACGSEHAIAIIKKYLNM